MSRPEMLKRVLNLHEEATHQRLKKVSEAWEAVVFPKIRLADVFPIENSGIDPDLYKFALQSHFDFIVTSGDYQPQFAVEFDGRFHKTTIQQRRDSKKNRLAELFELPLLRINSNYLLKRFRELDLLTWFASCWFCHREHSIQQRDGSINAEDIFDPRFVHSFPDSRQEFPLWISRRVQGYLRKQFFEGKVVDFMVSHMAGVDQYGVYRGIAWVMLDRDYGIVSRTAMQPQMFDVGIREATEEIAIFGLREKFDDVQSGKSKPVSKTDMQNKIDGFQSNHQLLFACYGGKIQPSTGSTSANDC